MRPVRVVQPAAVLVQLLHRDRPHRRQVDVVVTVLVPVVRRGRERRVRVGGGDDQEERIVLRVPRQIVEFLDAVELDLVVVVDLQAAHALAGLHHRAEADPGRAVLRLVGPVRCPGEVGRVDVSGEPLLEAVELVWADEVHLAAEDGVVAEIVGVVGHRRPLRRELDRVVPGGRSRWCGVPSASSTGKGRRGESRSRRSRKPRPGPPGPRCVAPVPGYGRRQAGPAAPSGRPG